MNFDRKSPSTVRFHCEFQNGQSKLELVVLDRVQETGKCTATSNAADEFDGDITFTMGSIDVSVTVDDTTVSERRKVYLSGCT